MGQNTDPEKPECDRKKYTAHASATQSAILVSYALLRDLHFKPRTNVRRQPDPPAPRPAPGNRKRRSIMPLGTSILQSVRAVVERQQRPPRNGGPDGEWQGAAAKDAQKVCLGGLSSDQVRSGHDLF